MQVHSIFFKGLYCFWEDWSGFETVAPINVIVGKNNTGKSRLLELAKACCNATIEAPGDSEFRCRGKLGVSDLKDPFREGNGGGSGMYGDHWRDNGRHLVDATVTWTVKGRAPRDISFSGGNSETINNRPDKSGVLTRIAQVLSAAMPPLSKKRFVHLGAERNIVPEKRELFDSFAKGIAGVGASAFATGIASDVEKRRELMTQDVLEALNVIFQPEGNFVELAPRHLKDDVWELHLKESGKGFVSLSNSGSGLKTVLLVLFNLLCLPEIEGRAPEDYVYAFEELENNLHPALLGRLLRYITVRIRKSKATLFLTTHSSVCLDFYRGDSDVQLLHVTHDGRSARVKVIDHFFDKLDVLTDLGAKPSDLLQANGVIWCEGPSDRIYLNKWIELASNGELRAGRDYQCAYYGGTVLADLEATDPDTALGELVNVLTINPNVAFVCDSDKATENSPLKARVERIQAEIRSLPEARRFIWVLEAREIENYLPAAVLNELEGRSDLAAPTKLERFWRQTGSSYYRSKVRKQSFNKSAYARKAVQFMTSDQMEGRFDWKTQIDALVAKIRVWNQLRDQ